jgi:hypothetical protein
MRTERHELLPRLRALRGVGAWLPLALLLAASTASAQAPMERDLEVGLSYRAPPSCPSGSLFLEALREHLSAGDGPLDADVQIVRRPTSKDFELRLQLRVAGERFERVATSTSCETLVRLAALNAGIARSATPEQAVAELDEPAQAKPIPLAPPAPPRVAQASDDAHDPGVTHAHSSPGDHTSTRGFALVALRAANAMLPELAWGEGAAAGLQHGPWSLRLTGLWWGSRREQSSMDGSSPLSLSVEQASLELAPCVGSELTSALRIEGCVLLAGHRVHTSQAETHIFGTAGAGALISVRLWRGLRLELQGGLQAAPSAPRLHVARRVRFYQAEPFQPLAQLGLGWEFGAAPATSAPEPAFRPAESDVREAAR